MKTTAQPLLKGASRPLDRRASVSDAPFRLPKTANQPRAGNNAGATRRETTTVNDRSKARSAPKRTLGAFNPALPLDGSLIVAEVLRDQFTSLEAEIQLRATQVELTNGLAVAVSDAVNLASNSILPQTSNNTNSVGTLSTMAAANYDQWQMQAVMDKLDELINALRR